MAWWVETGFSSVLLCKAHLLNQGLLAARGKLARRGRDDAICCCSGDSGICAAKLLGSFCTTCVRFR